MGHKTILPAKKYVCVSLKKLLFLRNSFVFRLKSRLECVCVA